MKFDETQATEHTSLWPLVGILLLTAAAVVASLISGDCCGR